MAEKQHIEYVKNIGGLNFSVTQSNIDTLELSDGQNVDINIIGGYMQRAGAYKLMKISSGYIKSLYYRTTPRGTEEMLCITSDGKLNKIDGINLISILEKEVLLE